VSQFLAGKHISAMDHTMYSPGSFQDSRSVLKGKRFSDVEDIKSFAKKKLTDNSVKDFKNCFEQWPKR
jgi:hypothetical protein